MCRFISQLIVPPLSLTDPRYLKLYTFRRASPFSCICLTFSLIVRYSVLTMLIVRPLSIRTLFQSCVVDYQVVHVEQFPLWLRAHSRDSVTTSMMNINVA